MVEITLHAIIYWENHLVICILAEVHTLYYRAVKYANLENENLLVTIRVSKN